MTTNKNRQEAIARIMAVANEIAEREAAAAQAYVDRKKRNKAASKARLRADPERWKAAQRKKVARRDERRRERMKTDPEYAAKLREQRRGEYLRRREREGSAKLKQKTRESVARRRALDPAAFKEKQKEYKRRAQERQKARMEIDPVYAEQVRAKRRAKDRAKRKRQAAELREFKALKKAMQTKPPENPDS